MDSSSSKTEILSNCVGVSPCMCVRAPDFGLALSLHAGIYFALACALARCHRHSCCAPQLAELQQQRGGCVGLSPVCAGSGWTGRVRVRWLKTCIYLSEARLTCSCTLTPKLNLGSHNQPKYACFLDYGVGGRLEYPDESNAAPKPIQIPHTTAFGSTGIEIVHLWGS